MSAATSASWTSASSASTSSPSSPGLEGFAAATASVPEPATASPFHWAAFVLVGGRAELRRVQVGRSSGIEMQILDGLKAGEEVILYPGDRVHERERVKPIQISQ